VGTYLPANLLEQYDAATQAWKDGNSSEALAGLEKLAAGPWGEEARRGVGAQARCDGAVRCATAGRAIRMVFVDQLLAFPGVARCRRRRGLRARYLRTDLKLQRNEVIARAQGAMDQARTLWQEYRSKRRYRRLAANRDLDFGSISGPAPRLLAEASRYAQQSFLIYSQVDAPGAAPWTAIRDEIESEARQQRSSLHDLGNVIEPELLQTKLALLGDPNE